MATNDIGSAAGRRVVFRRWIMILAQVVIFVFAVISAFLLRFDFTIPPEYRPHLLAALVISVMAKAPVFRLFSLDRGWWRYFSLPDLLRLFTANATGSAAITVLLLIILPGFPRSIYILDFLGCLSMTTGIRLAVRVVSEMSRAHSAGARRRTLIYGAGDAGVSLVREIRCNPALCYEVIGFIDDDPSKVGRLIQRIPVFGPGAMLASVAARNDIEIVLIAAPSASGTEMTRILRWCSGAAISYKTVPGLAEIIEANTLATQIRDVAVEDLLGRKAIRLDSASIRQEIEGKTVLVTGAGGSIGSELCRQIARFRPAGIVGFEVAESPLFEIDREMRLSFPGTPFYAEIGSIRSRDRLDEVFRKYTPDFVYHAAAYKHVPMMEAHVFEAIENNVFGTYNVAAAALQHGVQNFVMISSDKAVRPMNVMGATKRIAELLLLKMQNGGTQFVAVRFGNVLGSNGSVIPTFKKQIAAGGPITVTHPEMRRFFMCIPEACQLVLQASAVGRGGQICVLDMGEPLKIVELAENLILLSGLRPHEDIKIEFTGMRPGEKLYEELSSFLDRTVPTRHEKIRIYTGSGLPERDIFAFLHELDEICQERNLGRLLVALKEIVVDYSPSADLLKRLVEQRQSLTAA